MPAHRAAAAGRPHEPPRSWLFVPGDSERKMAKALARRRRRRDPRSGGFGGRGAQAGGAPAGGRTSCARIRRRARQRSWVRINPLTTAARPGGPRRRGSGRTGRHRAAQARQRRRTRPASAITSAPWRRPRVCRPDASASCRSPRKRRRALFTLGSYGVAGPRLAALTWGAEDLPAAVGAADQPRRRRRLQRPVPARPHPVPGRRRGGRRCRRSRRSTRISATPPAWGPMPRAAGATASPA